LNRSGAVRQATAEYLANEDTFGEWIEDRCSLDPDNSESSAILFADWSLWCTANKEIAHTRKWFAHQLEARGCIPQRTAKARGFRGIVLKSNQ
jgi:putative DNA primase/helicase